ncbi:MAG: hypothetical protein IPG74_06440 [Flavobacteriales bacterium]|nr:hypothetical protein [Flavobacteriales bacterium]
MNSLTYTTSGTYTEVIGCTTHELVLTINTSGPTPTAPPATVTLAATARPGCHHHAPPVIAPTSG